MLPKWCHHGSTKEDKKMPNLNIRNLSDKAYKKLKERATINGRSINKHVLYILNESLGLIEIPNKKENDIFRKVLKLREKSKGMKKTDSVKLIREMRDLD